MTMPTLRLLIPAGNGPSIAWTGDEIYDLRNIGLAGIPDESRNPPGVVAEALLQDGGWDLEQTFSLMTEDGEIAYRGTIASAAGLTPEGQYAHVGRSRL